MSTLPYSILYLTGDGVISALEPGERDPLALRPKDAFGKSVFDVFPRSVAEDLTNAARRAIEENRVVEREIPWPVIDGGTRFIRARFAPTDEGEVVALLQDLTEWRQTEQARRQTEKIYKLIFDIAPFAFILHDGERIISMNRKALSLAGFSSPEDAFGQSIWDWVPPEGVEVVKERLRRMLETGEPAPPLVERLVSPTGKEAFVEIAAAPFEMDGKTAIMVIARDITQQVVAEREKRALEQKLLQVQKLEAIGRLAGGIAHEFNNLLNGIIGYAELVKESLSASHPAFEHVEQILKTALDAAKLTRQILSFARRGPLQKEPFLANDAVREVVEIISKTVPRKIQIKTQLSDEEPVIAGDIARIEQVLMNLCVNACDAMPEGGTLTVKTETVWIDGSDPKYSGLKPGEYVKLTVSDTGVGMDEETLKRVFDPFFTTKEPGKGTGLGLSIAYNTVHDHGGDIRITSAPGAGTTVTVLLPASKEPVHKPKKAERGEHRHEGSGTILVADDEDVVRRLLTELLRGRGYNVLPAENGAEALEIFEKRKDEIDLVILDVIMPKMDGFETLQKMLALSPNAKVIMLSGYAQEETLRRCLQVGAKDFIQKPFRIDELSEKIWALLRS